MPDHRRSACARPSGRAARALLGALALLSGLACATAAPPGDPGLDFFAAADPHAAPWYAKIQDWQRRMLAEEAQPLRAQPASHFQRRHKALDGKIGGLVAEERARLARLIARWAREEGRRHYKLDEDQSIEGDHWPTYRELAARNGDDCDGLDLIAYHLLIAFGFPRDELYRAVMMRNRDQKNHMVTLWFEDPKDPWVFDATGALTRRLIRYSEMEGWTPTAVFNEHKQFQVVGSDFVKSARAGH